MKSSIVTIIGGALEILGCCALAFAGLLAWAKWGESGGWFTSDQFPEIDRIVRIAMTISIVIGVGQLRSACA